MCVHERLKDLLKSKGLSLRQVSQELDIPYRTLQTYWLGQRLPSAECLMRLSTYFGVSVQWILLGNAPPDLPGVEERPGMYIADGLLKNICAMVMQMSEEERLELLKHIENLQLLAEIREERKKMKEGA